MLVWYLEVRPPEQRIGAFDVEVNGGPGGRLSLEVAGPAFCALGMRLSLVGGLPLRVQNSCLVQGSRFQNYQSRYHNRFYTMKRYLSRLGNPLETAKIADAVLASMGSRVWNFSLASCQMPMTSLLSESESLDIVARIVARLQPSFHDTRN